MQSANLSSCQGLNSDLALMRRYDSEWAIDIILSIHYTLCNAEKAVLNCLCSYMEISMGCSVMVFKSMLTLLAICYCLSIALYSQ